MPGCLSFLKGKKDLHWNAGNAASPQTAYANSADVAICKEHASQMPSIEAIYVGKNDTPRAVVVADALCCGECHPEPQPVDMPEIY